MLKLTRLLGYGLYPLVVGCAEGVYRYAGGEVYVYFSRIVPDYGALAAFNRQRKPRISPGDIFFVLLLYRIHNILLFRP